MALIQFVFSECMNYCGSIGKTLSNKREQKNVNSSDREHTNGNKRQNFVQYYKRHYKNAK